MPKFRRNWHLGKLWRLKLRLLNELLQVGDECGLELILVVEHLNFPC
jgi:hypothetical protein